MTWEYFLQNAITPAISAGAALLISWIISKNKKGGAGVVDAVKTAVAEVKLDIQKMFEAFETKLEERIEKYDEKNERAHKEFYNRIEKIEKDTGNQTAIELLKQRIETIERQHEKNHGG